VSIVAQIEHTTSLAAAGHDVDRYLDQVAVAALAAMYPRELPDANDLYLRGRRVSDHVGDAMKLALHEVSERRAARAASVQCELCGAPADRIMNHGADGAALFCGAHDDEVEPLACEPIGEHALYALNDAPEYDESERVTTLEGFIEANTDDGYCSFDDEELAVFRALSIGEKHVQNDGCHGTWTIRRIA
jgi:hypothetical protein